MIVPSSPGSSSSRFQGFLRISLALLASSAVFTAGCANFATTASDANSLASGAALTGKIHGGNQPVSGAVVKLWYAGQAGVGSASVAATTTSASDGSGSFSFIKSGTNGQSPNGNTFSCPTSGDPLVYVVATGGNTLNNGNGSINNAASVFLGAYGLCSTLSASNFVDLTEVTTVASMAALQQYFDPNSETLATSGSNLSKQALSNAFAIIPNMVDTATGVSVTSRSLSALTFGQGATGTTTTATPETAKINTLANIISACVNNAAASATNCTTLFNNAAPPDPTTTSRPYGTTFSTANDVLQAIYFMLTNPTDGSTTRLTNLFNLSPASGAPYQPVLASAPTDWTIAISYSSSSTCGTNSKYLIKSVQDIAVDAFGGIWLANNEAGGNLAYLNYNGQPVSCVAIGTGLNTGVAVDSTGGTARIWLADSGAANVYRYIPNGAVLAMPSTAAPLSIAADGTGNIYYTGPSSGTLYQLPQAAGASTAVTPVVVSNAVGSTPAKIFLDNTASTYVTGTSANLAIWTTSGSTFLTRSTSAAPNSGTGFTSATATGLPSPTYGLSVTAKPSGNTKNLVYASSGSSNSLSNYTGNSTTTYTSVANWPVTTLQSPAHVASDGAQNVWTINNTGNSVVAIGSALQNISPTGGFVKTASYLGGGRSIIIDTSGNVWIGLDGANSITEIVGAAVPVYQPYSYALKNNAFQVAP